MLLIDQSRSGIGKLPDRLKNGGLFCIPGEAESKLVAFVVLAAAVATGTTRDSWGYNIQIRSSQSQCNCYGLNAGWIAAAAV